MRELKFRIWDHVCGCFTNKPDAYHEFLTNGKPVDLDWALSKKENFTVQQYTGLKDKNGREIYEGDIVKLPYKTKLYLGRKLDEHGKDIGALMSEDKKDFHILYEVFHFNGTYGVSGDEYTVLINGFVIKQVLDTRSEIEPYSVEKNGKIRLFGLPHEFESCGAFGLPSDKTEVVGNIFETPELPKQ